MEEMGRFAPYQISHFFKPCKRRERGFVYLDIFHFFGMSQSIVAESFRNTA